MKIQNNGFLSIEQLTEQYLSNQKIKSAKTTEGASFQEILQLKTEQSFQTNLGNVKFSKHATCRLADRNIELTSNQVERLNDGTQKAQQKGIKDSLVIVDQLAFIVNVPNNTVITAMDSAEATNNVFTNIDGAIIM